MKIYGESSTEPEKRYSSAECKGCKKTPITGDPDQTLRITPAMAAGVTDRVFEISDVVRLMDEREAAMKAERKNALDGPALRPGYKHF